MSILIPFIIIAVLLTKSKKLAVEYSGEMGKAVMKGAQMVGGLALGAATGGAALGLSSTFGAKARATANDDNLKKAASGDKEHFAKLAQTDVRYKDPKYQQKMQAAAQKKLASANKTAARSFDLGQTTIGKGFGKMSGMDLTKGRIGETKTENLKGGRTAQQERVQEEAQKRTKSYHMTGAAAAEQNDKVARATQYKVDKEKAKETSDTKDNEVWKKEYETKARENKFSANPVDEKTFEENYKKNNPQSTPSFNEKEFKATYEKGDEDSLKNFGIEHEVKAGNVDENAKTVKKINEERTTAYANSLQTKADKDAARGAVKTMFEEFVKGAKKTALKPAVLGLGASGVLTGGAGTILAGATVLGGGFLGAFKGLITSKSKLGFMEGVKKSETAETIAAIRKGEDPNKWMKDAFKKLEKGEHVDNEKLVDTVSKAIKHEEPAPASHSNDTAPKNHDTHEH